MPRQGKKVGENSSKVSFSATPLLVPDDHPLFLLHLGMVCLLNPASAFSRSGHSNLECEHGHCRRIMTASEPP